MSTPDDSKATDHKGSQAIVIREMNGPEWTGGDEISAKQLPRTIKQRLPKSDSRYWLPRIYKPVNGRREESPHYAMRVAFKGTRMGFSLGTGNKDAAARRARDIYGDLLALGIEATLRKHRTQKPSPSEGIATVADWIEAAEKVFDGRPATFGSYARCLRMIGADVLGLVKTKKRFGRGNTEVFRDKIDAAGLDIFTPEAIQAWRIKFVQSAGENPARQRAARISCNSALRQARSLFSRKMLKFMRGTNLPKVVPFKDVDFYPRESMRYSSKINPGELLGKAQKTLATVDHDAFLALLLAICGGLRRGEIDRLLWRQVNFDAGTIQIEATEAGALKSADSAGDVPIDEMLLEILRGFKEGSRSPFVIEGHGSDTSSRIWGQRYRCGGVFDRLLVWLRKNGVNEKKPLHTLRKEAGSIIATKSGIYAASRFLRHADIQVTAQHYTDHKERVSIDLKELLRPAAVERSKPANARTKKAKEHQRAR